MRADGGIQSALGQVLVEFAADATGAQTLSVLVHEERALIKIGGSGIGMTQLQVFLNRRQRREPDRRRALLLALAAHANRLTFEVHVREVQVHQFADPNAGGEQHLEHGLVAGAKEGVVVGRGQQLGDLLHFEELRQPLFLFGSADRGQRMGLHVPPSQTELVETPQRRQLPRDARLGKPAVMTGYGGQLDYLSPDLSWMVDYEMVSVYEPGRPANLKPGVLWAAPSVSHAATQLREVYDNQLAATAQAQQLAGRIAVDFSREATVNSLLAALS